MSQQRVHTIDRSVWTTAQYHIIIRGIPSGHTLARSAIHARQMVARAQGVPMIEVQAILATYVGAR